ncbi:hypothetical protein [uncultured Corynebacterium sp.]|uniref:hypothetical protein n=1 Tax=uncultured Corynebacterium sp. TaxID=159447 RepID=UPI0025FF6FA3|nr:hypothetical protein [uncultured Corynebacterium sp.]
MKDPRLLPKTPDIDPLLITRRRLCAGRPEWSTPNPPENARNRLTHICHHCPALTQCEAYLKAYEDAKLPIAGVIAGREWGDTGRVTCRKGHTLTLATTAMRGGYLYCRTCERHNQ